MKRGVGGEKIYVRKHCPQPWIIGITGLGPRPDYDHDTFFLEQCKKDGKMSEYMYGPRRIIFVDGSEESCDGSWVLVRVVRIGASLGDCETGQILRWCQWYPLQRDVYVVLRPRRCRLPKSFDVSTTTTRCITEQTTQTSLESCAYPCLRKADWGEKRRVTHNL